MQDDLTPCREIIICDEEYDRLLKFLTDKLGNEVKARTVLDNAIHCGGAFINWRKRVPPSLYERICILTGWRYFKKDEIMAGYKCIPYEAPDPIDEKYIRLTPFQKKLIESYLKQFPFLDNEQDLSSLMQLVQLETALDTISKQLANGDFSRTKIQDVKKLVEAVTQLKSSLGISGKDRLEYMRQSESSSIADLVAMANELTKNPEFYQAKEDMLMEEILILVQRIRRGEAHKNILKMLYGIEYEEAVEMLREKGLISRDGTPVKAKIENMLGFDTLEKILKLMKRRGSG